MRYTPITNHLENLGKSLVFDSEKPRKNTVFRYSFYFRVVVFGDEFWLDMSSLGQIDDGSRQKTCREATRAFNLAGKGKP